MSESALSIALVGLGRWGRNYVPLLSNRPDAKLGAVVEVDPGAMAGVDVPSLVPRCASLISALERGIDGVILATPSHTHAELALGVLAHRKPLLVEKPLATSEAGARAVAHAARGIPLRVGHLMLHHPAVRWLMSLVSSGELGELRELRSCRVSSRGAASHDSALWALGAHDVCLALRLAGQPSSVRAASPSEPPDTQRVSIQAMYASGLCATHTLSRVGPTALRRTTVVGSRGRAGIDEVAASGWHQPDGAGRLYASFPDVSPLARQLEAWLGLLRGAPATGSDAEEGLAVVEVLAAAERSLALGGRTVSLSLQPAMACTSVESS